MKPSNPSNMDSPSTARGRSIAWLLGKGLKGSDSNSLQPTYWHGGAGVGQHQAQQALDPLKPPWMREGQHAVEFVLHGAQH